MPLQKYLNAKIFNAKQHRAPQSKARVVFSVVTFEGEMLCFEASSRRACIPTLAGSILTRAQCHPRLSVSFTQKHMVPKGRV